MEDFTDSRIEREIDHIRSALKELNPHNCSDSLERLILESPRYNAESTKNESAFNFIINSPKMQRLSDQWELNVLLEAEKEKNLNLEQRLAYKDKLLEDLTSLQSELYVTIEDLQSKETHLPFKSKESKIGKEADEWKDKYESSQVEVIKLKEIIKIKNTQIEKLKKLNDENSEDQEILISQFTKENSEKIHKIEKENRDIKNQNEELKKGLNYYHQENYRLHNELQVLTKKFSDYTSSSKNTTHFKRDSLNIETGTLDKRQSEQILSPTAEIQDLQVQIKNLESKINRSHQNTPRNETLVYREVFKALGVSNENDAVKRVLYLENHHRANKKYCKLYRQIIELIKKCQNLAPNQEISVKFV